MDFDHELSRQLGKKVRARNRECWHNAIRALVHAPNDAYYVEGYAVKFVVAEHAWLEVGGKIVDPTPAYRKGEAAYFPAQRFTSAEVVECVEREWVQPFTTEGDQIAGLRFPKWRRAYLAGWVWIWGREAVLSFFRDSPLLKDPADVAFVQQCEQRPQQA